MKITRTWAMPNSETFSIKPIKEFVERHIANRIVIVDPFARNCKYGTITNDLNPECDALYHMDALEFLKTLDDNSADCVLYDPPYSIRQASECYNNYGKDKLQIGVTNMKYWSLVKDQISRILKPNGVVLCFGWNSSGIGKNRGGKMIEILMVNHGGSRNDTICTAEYKEA